MPLNAATVSTCDMSPLLRFHFWEPVFFNTEDNYFPSDSPEERGCFVGISDNVGYDMTFKILNNLPKKSLIDLTLDQLAIRNLLTFELTL